MLLPIFSSNFFITLILKHNYGHCHRLILSEKMVRLIYIASSLRQSHRCRLSRNRPCCHAYRATTSRCVSLDGQALRILSAPLRPQLCQRRPLLLVCREPATFHTRRPLGRRCGRAALARLLDSAMVSVAVVVLAADRGKCPIWQCS